MHISYNCNYGHMRISYTPTIIGEVLRVEAMQLLLSRLRNSMKETIASRSRTHPLVFAELTKHAARAA